MSKINTIKLKTIIERLKSSSLAKDSFWAMLGTVHLQATAYDADDTPLYEHEIDIPMRQNHVTWLTGSFFSSSPNASFTSTVSLNTTWNGETHLTY